MTEEQEAASMKPRAFGRTRAAEVFPILNRPADPEKRRQLNERQGGCEARARSL